MQEAYRYTFSAEVEAEREAIRTAIRHALTENTLPAIRAAQARLRGWLQQHPEDYALWDAGEPLAMTADALEAQETPAPAIAR